MRHGVCPYIGLNEIGNPSPIMTFITINYLFNFIFGFIRWYFGFIRYDFWDYPLEFLFVLINSTLCYWFLIDLINIEKFRILFSLFYSFSFILRSRATSIWYQSITSIRDQVIPLLVLIRDQFDPSSTKPFRPRSSQHRQGVSRHSRCRRTSKFQPFSVDEIYRRQPMRSVVVSR